MFTKSASCLVWAKPSRVAAGNGRPARLELRHSYARQYLQPTLKHLPVVDFIEPARFEQYGQIAREMGSSMSPTARSFTVPTTLTNSKSPVEGTFAR